MKGLKKIMATLMVAALAVGLVGCGQKEDNTDQLQAIKDKGELVIGTSAEFAPFEFHKIEDGNDEIVGVDVNIAEEIGKALGVKVTFQDMDFDGLIPALQAGKVDMVLAGVSPTDERKEKVDFSEVYFVGKNSVVVLEGQKDKYKSVDEIKDLKIGVQKGSIQESYVANDLQASQITSLAQIPELMMELKNKNIDAMVVNDTVAMINVGKTKGVEISSLNLGANEDEAMAVAFNKGNNQALVDEVNKVIKELKDSGKIDQFINDNVKIAVE